MADLLDERPVDGVDPVRPEPRDGEDESAGGDDEEIEIIGFEAVDECGIPIREEDSRAEGEKTSEEEEEAAIVIESSEEDRAEALEAELAALRDRHQRLRAEFDNYRRRRDREAEEAGSRGAEVVMKEMLPIVDNLGRALESASPGDASAVKEGVELIRKQLTDALARQGIETIDALGEKFDPEVHEAVATVERTDFDDQTVIEELQKGYRFQGRLLRPSLVRVVMNPEGNGEPDGSGGE